MAVPQKQATGVIMSFMLEKPQASFALSLNVKLADASLGLTDEPQRCWASTAFACMPLMLLQVATQVLVTVELLEALSLQD